VLRRWAALILVAAGWAGAGGPSDAQAQVAGAGGGAGSYVLADGERNLKFAGIPVPGYSEVLGANLGLVAMAYYKTDRHDDTLPPSSTGVFGFYSANNSWVGAAFQQFHLDGDRWRAMGALGTGSVKYQFNPASIGPGFPDVFIDYTTATGFLFAQGQRRTWEDLYLGLAVLTWSARVDVAPDLVGDAEERYAGAGVLAEWDGRNHVMTPTDGVAVEARWLVYGGALGSDRDFRKLKLTVRGYRELGDSTRVLAGRILHEGGYGDVPFSSQTIVSGNQNLRGYANGRYRADHLLVVEAEYRWNFWRRWGAATFAGLGWSADSLAEMSLADTLPAAGLGLRFRLIEAYRVNARIDYGWGRNDQAVYFSIGEAY